MRDPLRIKKAVTFMLTVDAEKDDVDSNPDIEVEETKAAVPNIWS